MAGRGRRTETPGKGEDRVFLPGRKDPVYLSRWPAALFLLQRIRDEAHRFAITAHRKRRAKQGLASALDSIPGIGPARRKSLLKHFGSVDKIRDASVIELAAVPGITPALAENVKASLE